MLPDGAGFFRDCSRWTPDRPVGPGVLLCAGVARLSGSVCGVDPALAAGAGSDPSVRRGAARRAPALGGMVGYVQARRRLRPAVP